MSREYTDTGIRINKGQRRWRRYGSKILAICIAAAAIIAIIAIAAAAGGSKKDTNSTASSNPTTTAAQAGSGTESAGNAASQKTETAESGSSSESEGETKESTEAAASSQGDTKGGTVSGTPVEEEFTSADFYEDAAFIGDLFVYGIDEYEYIPSSNLFSASFMTAAKAMDLTDDVTELNPGKIFVMLGFDDDNLAEDRTPETSAQAIIGLLEELKEKNPNANIYAVSEIPISEDYNDGGGDYVTQEDLDEINSLVKTGAAAAGIGYVNVADSLKNGNYLSGDYTTDGCHVMKQYYPFVLNSIAKVAK